MMRIAHRAALAAVALMALAGCGQGNSAETSGTAAESSSSTASSSTSSSGSTTSESPAATTSTGGSATAGLGDKFEAFGTEPFWNVAVDGTTLKYTQVSEPDRTLSATRKGTTEAPVYSGIHNGFAFSLTITKAECSDGMSDNTYLYKAVFTYGGRTLNGCVDEKK